MNALSLPVMGDPLGYGVELGFSRMVRQVRIGLTML